MKPMPKTILRKINVFLLSVILACTMLPVHADAAYEIPGICQVQTDTGAAGTVKTMDYNYDRGHQKYSRPEPGKCLHPCGRGKYPLGKQRKPGHHPAAQRV